MKHLRHSLVIGLALFIGSASAASAGGDLMLPPGEPVTAYSDVPMGPSYRKIYLRGDIGVGVHDDPDIIEGDNYDLHNEEIEENFLFGIGIGKYFSPNVRGDITVDYRTDTAVTAYMPAGASLFANTNREHDLSSLVVLANLYYDFASSAGVVRGSTFTPYVGVGLGFATHYSDDGSFSGCCSGTIGDNTETSVAAAFMAGVAVNVRRHWKMDAGYRFLYMDGYDTGKTLLAGGTASTGTHRIESITAHEFRLGLRYDWR